MAVPSSGGALLPYQDQDFHKNVRIRGDLTVDGTVTPSGGAPGGTTTQVQYNHAGVFGGISDGTSGQVLTSNGAGVVPSFQSVSGTGTVTSVALTVPSFLSIAGSPVTTAGTLAVTLSGTALPVANGGSGATTLTGLVLGNGASAMSAVTAPAGAVVGTTDTQTLTNKRVTKRVVTAADASAVTPNSDSADITYQLNTQSTGTLTINADGGTPTNGQEWFFKIKSTNVQTFAWNAIFVPGAAALPTVTSGGGKIDYFGFLYDTVNSKWDFTGYSLGY